MMKKIGLVIGALLLFSTAALADCTGQFSAGQLCGNTGASNAPPAATLLSPLLDRNFGAPSPQGTILNRGASLWSATRAPVLGNPGTTTGTLGLGSASGGTATITPPAIAGNTAVQLPTLAGTIPTTATSPVLLNSTTGAISCPTCVTGTTGAITVGVTTTSGFSAGQVLRSDGSLVQAYSVTGSGNVVLSASPTLSGTVTINQNATAPPAILAGTVLQIANLDTTATRIELVGYGGNPVFTGRRSGGTATAPTATPSGAAIGGMQGAGYDTAWGTASKAAITFTAAETWAAGANGTSITFGTTTNLTTTQTTRWTISDVGNFTGTASTASSSTGTGAIVTAGGLGVAGTAYIGGGAVVTSSLSVQDASSKLLLTNSGGTNYLESGNAAFSANAPLIISGYNANRLTSMTLLTSAATFSLGANTDIWMRPWAADSSYNAIGLNGSVTAAGMVGLVGGNSTDVGLYYLAGDVTATYGHTFRVNNVNMLTLTGGTLANNVAHFYGTTDAASSTVGSVRLDGGIAVAKQVYAGGNAYFQGTSLQLTGATAGFEIGAVGSSNIPYIDFHSSASSTDYDVRLQASGGSGSDGTGLLTFTGSGGLTMATGRFTVSNTTDANGAAGGAINTAGGIDAAKNVNSSALILARSGTATPAGGSAGFSMGSTGYSVAFGSGAPTVSLAQGSLYLRSDGGVGTRAYINTNGTTGYVALADVNVTTLSSLATVGTLTGGATGAGFTVALGSSTVTGQLGLTNGGAGGSLTASNGGIVYSDASRLQILSGTATPNLCLLSGTSSAPSWGSCAGGATVTSIAGNTGVFTLGVGLTNSVNDLRVSLSTATNVLGADVNLNNTANYFDGPSMAQGTSGTWFASGEVTVSDASAATIYCKLWDGTTVISSGAASLSAGFVQVMHLAGYLASPAANIRISCRDISNTSGAIKFNSTGNSKDAAIFGIRIAP